nr:unnamed protein product [Callosobruchus chinensis]
MVITREIREEIKESINTSINSFLNKDDFLKELVQKVTDSVVKTISARLAVLEEKVEEISRENSKVIKELKDETKMLKLENEYLLQRYDDLDQKARINNLRIYKVDERPNENLPEVLIQILDSRLGIKLIAEDIVSCTRIGKRQQNTRPRGILVTFVKMSTRQHIYNKKKMLKGSGIVVKEDLTESRLKLMEAAIDKTSLKNVWSYNGTIYVMKGSQRISVRNKDDLSKI